MRFISTKNDIHSWPFQECASITEAPQLEEWAMQHGLTQFNTWMLPQILAYFGQFRVRTRDDNKLDAQALLADNIRGNDWAIGLWRICTKLKRSSLVKTQIHENFSEYSALVPLILAGIKKYQNKPYSSWSTSGLEYVVDRGLYEAMMCEPPQLPLDRVLELRAQGLMTKSGPNAGQIKKSTSTWTLTGLKHTEWGELPQLAVTMLAQIWVAHPSIRNSAMILDPQNWDAMPEPLIDTQVVKRPVEATVSDLPW